MTKKEFEEKVVELSKSSDDGYELITLGLVDASKRGWGGNYWEEVGHYNSSKQYTKFKKVLKVEWYTGGVSGGSCWDDGDSTHYFEASNKPPKELKFLDEILEHFNPNINFLQYKNLYNKLVKHDSRTQGEYYGNSSSYASVQIELDDLYEYMKEKGWLEK